jgi:lambda repressor-like predicted transcriptional regulator
MKTMKISEMIKAALDKKGYKNLKDASKMLDISPELLRVTINKGHIPKDNTLMIIAKKLNIDMSVLVLAAHQEKVPDEVKGYFLIPSEAKLTRGKRKYPLSEEQTSYLAKVLSIDDILLLRKFRQVSDEGRLQISGFIDFMYAAKKRD